MYLWVPLTGVPLFFQIRMQAQGSLFQGGMIGSFIDIYQQEGTRGLWRVSPSSCLSVFAAS